MKVMAWTSGGTATAAVLGLLVLHVRHSSQPASAMSGELTVAWDAAVSGVEIRGSALATAEDVRVYPAHVDGSDPTYPAVAGTLESGPGGSLLFLPRYPLPAGEEFVAVVRGRDFGALRSAAVTVPASAPGALARVIGVYPTAEQLPENQLKIYVEFSAPMRRWDPYDHVRVVDETSGEIVDGAFQALNDGLWDPAGTRLTMVFDPGRVKRGLSSNVALGPPLVRGHAYRLEMAATWRDALGQPLSEPYQVRFSVGAPDRVRPVPDSWRVEAPGPGSREPVMVDFGESMDRALLGSMLLVKGPSGAPVFFEAGIGPAERTWTATPREPWRAGEYHVVIDCRIEDLAGNNIERLFDVDLAHDGNMPESADGSCAVELPFAVGRRPGSTMLEPAQEG